MAEGDARPRSVLIVDDDPDFAESLQDMLEARGYVTTYVDAPEKALTTLTGASAAGDPIPVALIDLRLGGLASGVDLISRLRDTEPELICVLMTAQLDTQTAVAALRFGAYDYFDKSVNPNSLFAVLDRCFDLVKLQHDRTAAYEALKVAKEEAEAASRGKSAFLATMSHELRTPLNAIIGFSEMMTREVYGPVGNEQYRTYINDIHDSGAHLLQIINDILDLSKAEAGKLELFEDVFDPRDTIRSVRQLISARVRESGLTETADIPADFPLLSADERKTKQVLLNLVANAVKFTPQGGQISIVGRYEPSIGLTLTVSDTGIGIAPGDLTRVLKPFEQVDSSFTRSHEGTGLGLPLVKAIMELHGGLLELNSQLGVGTQVTVTFPADRVVIDPDSAKSRAA
ncbi:MAG: response regulator [Alphaproteobacteria bacterium]|nr:response regulator [Alphaproteobacteria bacterium]